MFNMNRLSVFLLNVSVFKLAFSIAIGTVRFFCHVKSPKSVKNRKIQKKSTERKEKQTINNLMRMYCCISLANYRRNLSSI